MSAKNQLNMSILIMDICIVEEKFPQRIQTGLYFTRTDNWA